jgi:PhnB protein
MMMRWKDMPEPAQPGMLPPGSEDKIMHATLKIGDSEFMASDGNCLGKPKFEGFSISIGAKDEDEVERLFKALSEGGEVRMPPAKTFFAAMFGMVADKFGVPWMIIAYPK